MKKRLLLHVGTGKTGTTAIQRRLALNRDALSAAGILYPDISPMVGGQRFYHNGLAAARIGEDAITPAAVAALAGLADDHAHEQVLLSIEALGVRGGEPSASKPGVDGYRKDRRAFVRRLGKQLSRFDVHPIIVLRRQDTFVESGYKQFVKRFPPAGGPVWSFADYRHRFILRANYDFQVGLLGEYLGTPTVLRYEDGDTVTTFADALDLPLPRRLSKSSNVSAPATLTAWMRALPVGTVKERDEFALRYADAYTEPGARTLWESQYTRDDFLSNFAGHTYGGDFFPSPGPIEPATQLAASEIARLSLAFGEHRRGRATARRLAAVAPGLDGGTSR